MFSIKKLKNAIRKRRDRKRRARHAQSIGRRPHYEPLENRLLLAIDAVDDINIGPAFGGLPFHWPAPGVLANDITDRGTLSVSSAGGFVDDFGNDVNWVTVNADGSIDAMPPIGFYGNVHFNYTATNGYESDTALGHIGFEYDAAPIYPEEQEFCPTCTCACEGVAVSTNTNAGIERQTVDGHLTYNGKATNGVEIVIDEIDFLPMPPSSDSVAYIYLDLAPKGTVTYSKTNYNTADSFRYAWTFPNLQAPSGVAKFQVIMEGPNGDPYSYLGYKIVNNLTNSGSLHYTGAHWGLTQHERLLEVNADPTETLVYDNYTDLVWIRGDGEGYIFISDEWGQFAHAVGDDMDNDVASNGQGGYTLTDRVGAVRFFSGGNLQWKEDRNGNRTTYTYGASGLETITEPNGHVTTYAYTSGKLTSITDFAGRVTTIGYDGDLLTTITRPDPGGGAPVLTYTYDGNDRMKTMTAPDGGVHSYEYNAWGGLSKHTYPNGSFEEFSVQQDVGMVLGDYAQGVNTGVTRTDAVKGFYTDRAGGVWEYRTDRFGGNVSLIDPYGNVRTTTRDPDGRVKDITLPDPDGAGPLTSPMHSYVWDGRGNLVSRTFWSTTSEGWAPDQFHGQPHSYTSPYGTTTNVLDGVGNILTQTTIIGSPDSPPIEENDIIEHYTYTATGVKGLVATHTDGEGRLTTYDRNTRGLVEKITYADSESVELAYDTYDRLETFTDELDRVTTYSYDLLDRLLSVTLPDPDGAAGPLASPVYSFTYDIMGRLVTETDPLGRIVQYVYDQMSDLKEIHEPDHDGLGGATVTTMDYDLASRLVTLTDPKGGETTYLYNALHQNTRITLPDPDGVGPRIAPEFNYVYDPLSRVTRSTDPLGNETDYTHDSFGFHVTTKLPDAGQGRPEIEMLYDNAGQLEKSIDPLDREVVYTRDEVGRVVRVERGTQNLTAEVQYEYDRAHNLVQVTDEIWSITDHTFDVRNRLIKTELPDPDDTGPVARSEINLTYDAAGQLKTHTDPLGALTEFFYDDVGRLVKMKLPDPGSGTPTYEYEYDAASNLTLERDPLLNETEYQYDAHNNVTQITEPDPDGAGPQSKPISTFAFDDVGDIVSITDALGRTTSYEYDAIDRLVKVTEPDPGGGAPVWEYVYDAANNLLTSTDPLGNVTSFAYDQLHRHTTTWLPDPDGPGPLASPIWTSNYDIASQLVSVDDPLSRTTTNTFDDLARLVKVIHPDPDGAGPLESPEEDFQYDMAGNLTAYTDPRDNTTDFTYDPMHRRIKIEQPDPDGGDPDPRPVTQFAYDADSRVTSVTDPLNRVTTYTYDALDRLTRETAPDPDDAGPKGSPYTDYTYDAVNNVLTSADALGQTTTYEYDNLYRLISEEDPNDDEVTFTYDAVDNLLSLTDPLANETTWVYDALDRVTSETNELSKSRTFEYDKVGNLTSKTDRNGRETEYDFDDLYRLTDERWLDSQSTTIHTLNWAYDAVDNLTSASDSYATYTFTFDDLDRATDIASNLSALASVVTLTQSFDANNNRTGLTADIGGTTDFINAYTFDSLNRMTVLTQTGDAFFGNAVADKRIDFDYDLASQLETITRAEDLSGMFGQVATTTFTFDNAGRLTDMTHAAAATLADYDWSYDAANRVTQVVSSVDGTIDYQYDARGQLTGATSVTLPDETYTYDDNGNRTLTGYSTGTSNQLLSDGVYNYEYDDEGNRTKKTKISTGYYTEYEWDHRNRLTSITEYDSLQNPQNVVTYSYDVFDRRIRKADAPGVGPAAPGDIETYVYDGAHIALSFDGNGDLTNRYLHGPAVDMILADEQVTSTSTPGNTLWPLTDNLGSVRDIADYDDMMGVTSIANHIVYDAFGEIQSETNAAVDHIFGYTGRDRDEESDLQYNRARYYDPAVGRWVSEDPIGFAAGDANLGRYVGNDATNATDPSGLVGGAITPVVPNSHHRVRLGSPTVAYWSAFGWSIRSNVVNGVKGLFTGEAGEAIGKRAVRIYENNTGQEFTGTAKQWRGVGQEIASQIAGTTAIAEGSMGVDMATLEPLDTQERVQRVAGGVGAFAGWASGGAFFCRALAGARSFSALPGSGLVGRAWAPVSSAMSHTASRVLPASAIQALSKAGEYLGPILNKDLTTYLPASMQRAIAGLRQALTMDAGKATGRVLGRFCRNSNNPRNGVLTPGEDFDYLKTFVFEDSKGVKWDLAIDAEIVNGRLIVKEAHIGPTGVKAAELDKFIGKLEMKKLIKAVARQHGVKRIDFPTKLTRGGTKARRTAQGIERNAESFEFGEVYFTIDENGRVRMHRF